MRQENSVFNAAFMLQDGDKLNNNDYYGCAELDRFACYVVADGISDLDVKYESAKIAVQAAIDAFRERPSIGKDSLRKYITAAHKALKENTRRRSLRVSITIVVTDYQKIRYAWAGNSRFFLYRSGRMIEESLDHSLSMQMATRGQLTMDKVAKHEERNNLSRYAGQPDSLKAQVSKKIELINGDVFVLLTREVWERCSSGEIHSALNKIENDPMQAMEEIKARMGEAPENDIGNYTVAIVLIDKIYIDPNKGEKLKKTLFITVPIAIILIALAITLLVMRNNNENRRRAMNTAFDSAVIYIENENHVRAAEKLTTSINLAGELQDDEFRERAEAWLAVMDAINSAGGHFALGNFTEAQNVNRAALYLSQYADNAGRTYIERRMIETESFITVRGLISLGDTLVSIGDLAAAEERYQEAWRLAISIGDIDGRERAISVLQDLYSILDREEARQARENERQMIEDALLAEALAREQESTDRAAYRRMENLQETIEMEAAGDSATEVGDYINAELFYTIARERFALLGEMEAVARIDEKLMSLSEEFVQVDSQRVIAAQYIAEGDRLFDNGSFTEARERYILARNIYTRLNDDIEAAAVQARINASDAQISRMRIESEAQQREFERQVAQQAQRNNEDGRLANEVVEDETVETPTEQSGNDISTIDAVSNPIVEQAIVPDNATVRQDILPAESTTNHTEERRDLEQGRGNISIPTTTPSAPELVLVQPENVIQDQSTSDSAEETTSHTATRRDLTESRDNNPNTVG